MFRKLFVGVSRHGRKVFEGVFKKGEGVPKKPDVGHQKPAQAHLTQRAAVQIFQSAQWGKSQSYLGQQLARYAVRKTLASELRQQFARSPIYREYRGLTHKLSLFAFVGIGFVGRNGENEDEGFGSVCEEIKGIFQSKNAPLNLKPNEDLTDHGLEDYQIGHLIAKGCNAAVYQAKNRLNDEESVEQISSEEESDVSDDSDIEIIEESMEVDDDEQVTGTFELLDHEFESFEKVFATDTDDTDSKVSVIDGNEEEENMSVGFFFSIGDRSDPETGETPMSPAEETPTDFNLAIKMMFNYDVESNAEALYRAMEKELVPATTVNLGEFELWDNGHRSKKEKSTDCDSALIPRRS